VRGLPAAAAERQEGQERGCGVVGRLGRGWEEKEEVVVEDKEGLFRGVRLAILKVFTLDYA
jgi:hypothetical protein